MAEHRLTDSGDTPDQARKLFDPESRAGFLLGQEGMALLDTQGQPVFGIDSPTEVSREVLNQLQERMRWECLDCGNAVEKDAMYCVECYPYGFWHWLKHYSFMAWR